MKVAIYTRVSTDKKEQKLSFQSQSEYYTQYCLEKGYDLYHIYADEGITGTKKDRKEFINMMLEAGLDVERNKSNKIISFEKSDREPKFNYILMKDITRFSRNLNIIDTVRALRDKKVYLIFEDMNITTEDDKWEFQFGLYMTFSQQESLDKSSKLKWAYERRKEQGKWHMSNPLFGYEYNKDKGIYEVNEEEAVWVKKAFDLYVNELEGTKNVATYLNNNNVKTRRGKEWRADGIKRMLTNEKYIGKVAMGKLQNAAVTSETKTQIKIDKENWKVIENGIAAIIDEETFNKAQEILSSRVAKMADGSKVGSKKVKSIFHKKIKCSKCGSFFTRVKGSKVKEGKTIPEYNYFCINRRTLKSCDMRGVSHNVLIRELQRLIDSGIIRSLILKTSGAGNEGLEINLFEKILDDINKQRSEIDTNTVEIQKQIDDVTKKIDLLYENFFNDDTTDLMKQITTKKLEQLAEEQNKLELKKLECSTAAIDEKERYIKEYYSSMQQLSKKKKFTVEELIEWIDRIEVHENRVLHFYFKFPSMYKIQFGDGITPEESDLVYTRFDVKY